MALPARAVRDLDGGLGPVATLALERRLGAGDGAPRGDRPRAPRSRARPLDGDDRCPDREGRPLRPDVPRRRCRGRGGRTIGTKRTLLVEILGLPLAARADSARPHDVVAARELLHDRLADLPSVRAIVGDRAYRGLAALAERKHLALDIKAPPPGVSGFVPIRPLYRIEHAFAGARALAPPLTLLRGHRGDLAWRAVA